MMVPGAGHVAVQVVTVMMVVMIDRQTAGQFVTKEFGKGRFPRDLFGFTTAADVAVQADDGIG